MMGWSGRPASGIDKTWLQAAMILFLVGYGSIPVLILVGLLSN